MNSDGTLGTANSVPTGSSGIAGGNFASNRVIIVPNSSGACVYATDAASSDIVGIDSSTQTGTGRFNGGSSDDGSGDGVGLAANSQYVYATYSLSYTIGTFRQQAGCKLNFVGDLYTFGINGPCMDFREPQIAGKFVYHCHILDHEDAGIMAIIQVNPK